MGPTEQEYRQALAWIEHMRTRVAQLETENNDLRRQLDDLRRGVGVAVVIQGRAVPLSALPPANSTPQTGARAAYSSTASQPIPAPFPRATSRGSTPYSGSFQPSAPLSAPLRGGAHSGPISSLYAENTWLTGQMPAVHPNGGAPTGQHEATGQRRSGRPSQRVTPEWLRDETQGGAQAQRGPVSRTSEQMPATAPYTSSTGARPRPRGGVQARPIGTQGSSERLPSLAELTGHIPAVRGRSKLSKRERDEYEDSFVLG